MANTRERVKDFPSIVGTIQSDDYIPVDGATQGVRKAQVKDIMDAPITGLDTIANTTKGAINELATTAGKVWVGTQAEYDALPDTKLTDNVLHCVTDGEPSAYDSIWDKVGTDPLDTTASDCSGAINEIKSSLSDLKHVPITTDTATFPSTVSIQGDNYYQKVGRLVIVNVNLKIVSSTKGWHRVTNYIPNNADRPIYGVLGNASDGDVDGIMQPFNITSNGVLEIYNTKTGTTYCQGSVAYFANDLG